MKKTKLKVEKSKYPDEEGTHLVVLYSFTEHGLSTKRIFKGSYQECIDKKNELEENDESKGKIVRIPRKK